MLFVPGQAGQSAGGSALCLDLGPSPLVTRRWTPVASSWHSQVVPTPDINIKKKPCKGLLAVASFFLAGAGVLLQISHSPCHGPIGFESHLWHRDICSFGN